jgi:hypothetical protein
MYYLLALRHIVVPLWRSVYILRNYCLCKWFMKKKKKKKKGRGLHNPSGFLQHNAKGNTCPVVFSNTMPKGTLAQWSFPTQWQRDHQPSGLLLSLQHWGLALTDLSISVMLETCSIIIVSYAFHTYSCSCYMLNSIYLYFHVHAFNT